MGTAWARHAMCESALRRRSSAARLLRSWVRIPPGAWMSVCCECCVLSGRGLCDGLITRPEESYRLWGVAVCDLEKQTSWIRRPRPTWGLSRQEKKKSLLYRNLDTFSLLTSILHSTANTLTLPEPDIWFSIVTKLLYEIFNKTGSLYIHVNLRRYRFIFNNQPDALIIQNLFCHKTLHSGNCSMKLTNDECTAGNSWWWVNKLPETCRFLWQKKKFG
jgi:hypothetical protein